LEVPEKWFFLFLGALGFELIKVDGGGFTQSKKFVELKKQSECSGGEIVALIAERQCRVYEVHWGENPS